MAHFSAETEQQWPYISVHVTLISYINCLRNFSPLHKGQTTDQGHVSVRMNLLFVPFALNESCLLTLIYYGMNVMNIIFTPF